MQIVKDRKLRDICQSEIKSFVYNDPMKLIATCADDEPVVVRKFPFMKFVKKIFHREKIPQEDPDFMYQTSMESDDSEQADGSGNSSSSNLPKGPLINASKLEFNQTGQYFLVGYENGDLLVFETKNWDKIADQTFDSSICSIQFSHDESFVLISTNNGDLIILDPKTWGIKEKKQTKTPNTGFALLSKDAQRIYTISDKKRVRSLDASTLQELIVFKGHKSGINMIALSPDDSLLATCGNDNKICIFNAKTGELIKMLLGHTDEVHSIVFSWKGNMLISSSEDYTLRLWDLNSYLCLKTIDETPNANNMIVSHELLMQGNVDGEIRLYKLIS